MGERGARVARIDRFAKNEGRRLQPRTEGYEHGSVRAVERFWNIDELYRGASQFAQRKTQRRP